MDGNLFRLGATVPRIDDILTFYRMLVGTRYSCSVLEWRRVPILAENRRAYHEYEILEAYEAGIQLTGFETKAVIVGRMNIAAAYAVIRGGEVWLLNASIAPYQPANAPPNYDPERTRKLLLKRSEIRELVGKLGQKGLTLLPLKVYTKGRRIKIELGLGRGKKQYDKRERIKEREAGREIKRTLKQY
jgi:SsrA-binding protein